MARIIDIEGIGPKYKRLLKEKAGISTTEALTSPLADNRFYIEFAPNFVSGAHAVVFNNFNAFSSLSLMLARSFFAKP